MDCRDEDDVVLPVEYRLRGVAHRPHSARRVVDSESYSSSSATTHTIRAPPPRIVVCSSDFTPYLEQGNRRVLVGSVTFYRTGASIEYTLL